MAKIVGNKAYAHRSYLHTLPGWASAILASYDIMADVHSLPNWNVVKIEKGKVGDTVSLLVYHDFETVDHPELWMATKLIAERVAGASIVHTIQTDYTKRDSRPILHRKETLVDETHPDYMRWAFLTKLEEEAGLLSRNNIGTSKTWDNLLREKGYKVMFSCLTEYDYEEDDTLSP